MAGRSVSKPAFKIVPKGKRDLERALACDFGQIVRRPSIDCWPAYQTDAPPGGFFFVNRFAQPMNAPCGLSAVALPLLHSRYVATRPCRSHPGAIVRSWSSTASVGW